MSMNKQPLEILRARLLKTMAKVDSLTTPFFDEYQDGYADGLVGGIEVCLEILDELVKELEA